MNIPLTFLLLVLFGTFTGDIECIVGTGGNSFSSVTSKVRSTTIAPSLALLLHPQSLSSLLFAAENFEVGILADTELSLMCWEVLNLEVVWDELSLGVRSEE